MSYLPMAVEKYPASVEAVAGEECSRAAKGLDCCEGDKKAAAVASSEVLETSGKKMWRLPLDEIEWILAQSNEPVCAEFRALKRANPSLLPSHEEEKDESMVLLYACARDCYEDEEKFARFQAWVRSEYNSKGFVEVDYDYFGERAEATRLSEEAREEVFKDTDLSSDSEDDDELKLLKTTVRSWV
ncbi:hypothetical protein CFC21_076370 [Triticum aestivum]|uniref:Uncharacterized protein n=3 Tax=Triticinae TaxID=1648030 RepID=A0A453JYM7_AEGTS|nr:uncharacterized protein LOC120963877 [Aegilops tauschii subsp. strangulata]KAF7070944.1 hypothetical protein CFC21_076370 [Triticum aestivum]